MVILQIVIQSAPYGRVKKQTGSLPLETGGYVKSCCNKTDDNVSPVKSRVVTEGSDGTT